MSQYILALDQGTTSSRAIVFGHDGRIVATAWQEFEQILPGPGLVEHDPEADLLDVRGRQLGAASRVHPPDPGRAAPGPTRPLAEGSPAVVGLGRTLIVHHHRTERPGVASPWG